MISSSTLVDGVAGIFRYEDGNAYEITIKPISEASHKGLWKKFTKGN